MREMKQANVNWLSKIPNTWEIRRTKFVFRYVKEIVGDKHENYERLSLTMKGVLKREKEASDGLQPKNFEGYQILRPNQLVFKLIDLENTATSRVGLSRFEGLVSPAYIVLKNEQDDNRFHYYQMLSLYYRNIFNSLGGDNVRSALTSKDLLEIPIIVPPMSEQIKIANYLDEKSEKIDMLIEIKENTISELKEYKKSIIQKATTKGILNYELKDSGIEWIKKIPVNWEILPTKRIMKKIKDICDIYNGEDIISLTMNGVIKRDLDNPKGKMPASFDGYQRVYKGNLLLCLFDIDVTPRCVGLICDDGLTSPAYSQFVLDDKAYAPFYNYYLTAIDNDKAYLHLSKNLRSAITEDDFGLIPIVLPPISEQKAVANYLDKKTADIDKLIEIKQKKIEELKDYKKALISECVTGNKEVK